MMSESTNQDHPKPLRLSSNRKVRPSRHIIPSLPVLTTKNTKQYPQWHKYVERVYGQSVSQPIDLNTFTWFYYYAPFDPPIVPRKKVSEKFFTLPHYVEPIHNIWTGELHFVHLPYLQKYRTKLQLNSNDAYVSNRNISMICLGLEAKSHRYGFVVRRNPIPEVYNKRYLEVLHVADNVNTNVQWFWHTIGSGVFIDLLRLHIHKRKVYTSRQHCEFYDHSKKRANTSLQLFIYGKDMHLHSFMNANKYDMIVFEQAHGIPEIIIRSNTFQSKTACVLKKKYTFTGLSRRKTCVCDSSEGIMNCAKSNTQMIYTHVQQELLTALRQNDITSLTACLNTLSRRECNTLLNEFIPIYENVCLKQSDDATFVLSLFTYALLFCTTHMVELCFKQGGRLSVPYPSEWLGRDNKQTISAGEGALEYYNRLKKQLKTIKHNSKQTHKKHNHHRKSRRHIRRIAYTGYLPKERIVGQLPTNLKFLNSLTLSGQEQRCLNALLRVI